MEFEQMTTLRPKYIIALAEVENLLRTIGYTTEEIEQLKTKARESHNDVLGYLQDIYKKRSSRNDPQTS